MCVRTIVSCRSYLKKCPAKGRMNEQTQIPAKNLCSKGCMNIKVSVSKETVEI